MNIRLTIFALILLAFACKKNTSLEKQNTPTESRLDTVAVVQSIISKNYPDESIYGIIKGDLNLDQIQDIIVITEKQCDSSDTLSVEGSKCRKVYFLIKNIDTYKIAARNTKIIECNECGGAGVGDPYQNISIKNGIIDFESFYGACDKTIIHDIFKFNKAENNWFIYKKTSEDYSCHDTIGEINSKFSEQTVKELGKVSFNEY